MADRLKNVFKGIHADSPNRLLPKSVDLTRQILVSSGKVTLLTIQNLFAICIGLGALHSATDGKSTKAIFDGVEAAVGKENLKAAGQSAQSAATYVAKGWIGMAKEVEERSETTVTTTPPGKLGVVFSGLYGIGKESVEKEIQCRMAEERAKKERPNPTPE